MKGIPLADVLLELESGARPKGGVTSDSGEIPSIGAEHLGNDGGFNFKSIKRIPRVFFESLRSGRISPDDILIVKDGATTGKTSYVTNKFPFSEAALNEHVFRLKVDRLKSCPRFIFHFLRSPEGQAGILSDFRGATVGGISRDFVNKTRIPNLPLPEQRRIAAILDQADALRAKRREALAQLDSLTQSIFIELFGDPTTDASKFDRFPLQSVLEEEFQNGAYFQKEIYCDHGGVEMVHMSDAFGGVVKRGKLKRVSCTQSDAQKYSLNTGDLLIARRSLTYEGAAKPCMIPASDEPLIFESSFIRVRANKDRVTPLYLFHYLNNERIRDKYVRPYVTQSTISGINQSNLAQIPILQPPLNLQQTFASTILSIDSVRNSFVACQVILDSLFFSLQHRAFRGEL